DHATVVTDHLGQYQHALLGRGDLGHFGEVALDDDHANHAACHLDVSAAVMVRVVQIGALGVVLGQGDLDVGRHHRGHDVVGDAAGVRVAAVEMEVRVVELMRFAEVHRHQVAVGREVVGHTDLEGLARLHAQGRAWRAALIAAYVKPYATNV